MLICDMRFNIPEKSILTKTCAEVNMSVPNKIGINRMLHDRRLPKKSILIKTVCRGQYVCSTTIPNLTECHITGLKLIDFCI